MKINLPKTYSQLDPLYASTPIGNSTIGQIGCLTTIASMVACYFGHNETPSTLAKKVNYSNNLWIWSELSRLYPDIVYKKPVNMVDYNDPLTDQQMNEIRSAIDQGYPPFIKIKTPYIPEHWLLGVDYNGDDFLVADPLQPQGEIHNITDFGIAPKLVIYAYGWYTGNKPIQTVDYQKLYNDLLGQFNTYKSNYIYKQTDFDNVIKKVASDTKTDLINKLLIYLKSL